MSTRTMGLPEAVQQYLLSVSVPPDALWEQLRDETISTVGFNMQISPEQAQFMAFLIRLMNVDNALEIGTFTGYSALSIARALPAHGRLIACDVSDEWTSIGRKYWQRAGVDSKITLKIAPAADTLDAMIAQGRAGTIGFAFIDADKSNYVTYYEKCLELLQPGGVVCVDNTLWGGVVADPGINDADTRAIRDLNQRIFEDTRVTSTLLPIGDGLHMAHKNRDPVK